VHFQLSVASAFAKIPRHYQGSASYPGCVSDTSRWISHKYHSIGTLDYQEKISESRSRENKLYKKDDWHR
jgi:hypothetical protein